MAQCYTLAMKTALITGGSEGIGFALAKQLAASGHDLILASRSQEKLADAKARIEDSCNVRCSTIAIDLAEKDAAKHLHEKAGSIEVLVNCAGMGYTGVSWQKEIDAIENLITLNDIALVSLCSLYLKDMTEKQNGLILNVASTGGFQPGPYIAAYYASKAFVIHYSKAIALEARPYGVKVSCLCPGPCDTRFYDKSNGSKPPYAMDPDAVARYCLKHLDKEIIIPGLANRLALITPQWIRSRFVMQSKKRQIKPKP